MFFVVFLSPSAGLPSTPVPAEGPLAFSGSILHLPGKVKLTLYEDVDGDSLMDVVAVHGTSNPEEPARTLSVFCQREDGFPVEPDVTYRMPDDATLIDLGNVDEATPGEELLVLTGNGVRWLPLARAPSEGSPPLAPQAPPPGEEKGRPLVEVASMFAHADAYKLEKRDFARRVGDAQLATLFIPTTNGYRVYYPEGGYRESQDFPVPHFHEVDSDGYRVRPAEIHLADVNGDGREDFAASHLDELRIYFQENGRFHAQPDVEIRLGILTSLDRESSQPLDTLLGFKLADFDGDKLADVFAWKTVIVRKAVIHDKRQYQLYLNRGGRFDLVPNQAFVLKSMEDKPMLCDFNGDARLDLLTGFFEFTISNLVKTLLTNRLEVDLSFFLSQQNGFADQPDETRTFKIKFSFSNQDENFAPAVEVEGDYDGDGARDFLLQTEDERVEIFRGLRGGKGLFEREASVRLTTPASEHAWVKDMNGDGRDDIAFDRFPDRKPFAPSWINVVLSAPAPAGSSAPSVSPTSSAPPTSRGRP